jgi:3',5'-nucleoside bisphosphate phosphatase
LYLSVIQSLKAGRVLKTDRWDFHCHSTTSDGTLSSKAVVERALENGVTALALTDHDDVGGLESASLCAAEQGMDFVNGVEISIEWQQISIHVVGLNFDLSSKPLLQGLEKIRGGRIERARKMGDALARCGIGGAFAGAMHYAGNPQLISRAHFARFLVAQGICKDIHKVFDHYLVPGKPGYVDHRWVGLQEAIHWVKGAGGVAVVAHPGRYKNISGGAMKRFLDEFKESGGQGIEVVSGSHTPDHVLHFARLARYFGFYASRGSDFHGPEESYCDLGRLAPLPEDLKPVWRLFK